MSGSKPMNFWPARSVDRDLSPLGQRVLGMADHDQMVVPERDHLDLPDLVWERDQSEIDAVVQNVLVDEVRAAVLDPHVDGGKIVKETA